MIPNEKEYDEKVLELEHLYRKGKLTVQEKERRDKLDDEVTEYDDYWWEHTNKILAGKENK